MYSSVAMRHYLVLFFFIEPSLSVPNSNQVKNFPMLSSLLRVRVLRRFLILSSKICTLFAANVDNLKLHNLPRGDYFGLRANTGLFMETRVALVKGEEWAIL